MPTLIHHPGGRWLRAESDSPFDLCFSRNELDKISGDFATDLYANIDTESSIERLDNIGTVACYTTQTTIYHEQLTNAERFRFQRYRLRSLVEIVE